MKPTIDPPPNPTEAEIRHAAYLLWIEHDRPEGQDLEHWFAAKELLRHHHGRPPERGHRLALPTIAISARPPANTKSN